MIKWSVYTAIGFVAACIVNWYAVPCVSWSTIQATFALIWASPLVFGYWVGEKK